MEVSIDRAVVSGYLDSKGPTWMEVSINRAVVSSYLDARGAHLGGGIQRPPGPAPDASTREARATVR